MVKIQNYDLSGEMAKLELSDARKPTYPLQLPALPLCNAGAVGVAVGGEGGGVARSGVEESAGCVAGDFA